MHFEEIVKWCSFCQSGIAGGELEIPGDGVTLPVCDECMDDFESKVAPLVRALVADGPIQG